MAESYSRLKELFLNKPECVINLPEWLLSSKKINEYKAISNLAIVEIAGRDSVAAAIKTVEEKGFSELLPTYVYTGTEYGPWPSLETAVKRLRERLKGIKTHNLLVIGSTEFWRALNGRFLSVLLKKYGFYTPCVGCHLYLHAARIPLSLILGNKPIISGERESHNGGEKINQISEALDAYQSIFKEFNVPLLLPLRNVKEGKLVEDILGFEWKEGKEQLGCVLSGNYRDTEGNNQINKQSVSRYLAEFALPTVTGIIEAYVKGQIPDHKGVAKSVLG